MGTEKEQFSACNKEIRIGDVCPQGKETSEGRNVPLLTLLRMFYFYII